MALYKEFHAKGLNIIGVSLDKEKSKWTDAIAKDGLTWTQISNLKFWDCPIAKQYQIEGIPATILLDENGVIIGKNLHTSEIKAKLATILK